MTHNCSSPEFDVELLINHVGYSPSGVKKVVLQTGNPIDIVSFEVINQNNRVVYEGRFSNGGKINQWHTGNAFEGDFTKLDKPGDYYITARIKGREERSAKITIKEQVVAEKSLPLLLEGFQLERCVGEYDEMDKKMTFFGDREDTVDIHGGWYDASGEKGKYLSHLCFANYFTPQQTPMFVWNMMETADRYKGSDQNFVDALQDEIAFGSDFLVRMQDEEGYFYLTVFANWSWDVNQREISAYVGQDGKKNDQYQAGFREGGGITIAALARAGRTVTNGKFIQSVYLEAAKKGFDHLLENNTKYIDDGKENIIDDYCALLAATELYDATTEEQYLDHARMRAEKLIGRLSDDAKFHGWWRADDDGTRSYFHGAEAGLPLISLTRYLEIENDPSITEKVTTAIQRSIDFELNITNHVFNPFGYARQYVKAVNENEKRDSFFFPHKNESGYWWQGENARLGSLASAMYIAMPYLRDDQKVIARKYASDQINWVLGLNPYNVCMLEGIGYNNPVYDEGSGQVNLKGGICNGITSGFENEQDIDFMPLPYNDDMNHRWRWSEQWTLHGAWFMLAVAASMDY